MFDCERKIRNHKEDSKYSAYLADGTERKDEQVIEDLFGNPIVLRTKREARKSRDYPIVPVTCKLSQSEYQDLQRLAYKFGMSISSYARDCIRQQMSDHKCIFEP